MLYSNLNYVSILAASLAAIALTASPLSAHAPEYHVQPELDSKSSPTKPKPTPETTPNSSVSEISPKAETCSIDSWEQAVSVEENCYIELESNPAGKANSSLPPGIGELLLGLLAIAPFAMFAIRKRSQQ